MQISASAKKFRADRKNARRRKLRSLDPQKYLKAAREALNNEVAWVRSLFYSIRRRSFKNDFNGTFNSHESDERKR